MLGQVIVGTPTLSSHGHVALLHALARSSPMRRAPAFINGQMEGAAHWGSFQDRPEGTLSFYAPNRSVEERSLLSPALQASTSHVQGHRSQNSHCWAPSWHWRRAANTHVASSTLALGSELATSAFGGWYPPSAPEWISNALGLRVPFLSDPVRGLAPGPDEAG